MKAAASDENLENLYISYIFFYPVFNIYTKTFNRSVTNLFINDYEHWSPEQYQRKVMVFSRWVAETAALNRG